MPRAKEDNERLKDERREKIEQAATELFARRGLAATKISDIAIAAEMSLGLIYHYYSSKEELFDTLVRRTIDDTIRLIEFTVGQPLSAWEKLEVLADKMVGGIYAKPFTFMMVQQAIISEASSPEIQEVVKYQSELYWNTFMELVRQGQVDGDVAEGEIEELVALFFVCINGLGTIYAFSKDRDIKRMSTETVLRVFKKT
jgi:AcrR family transcriptional regulator